MRNRVRFLLGSELIVVTNPDPTVTVLQYLRTVARRTGTKEGCAEGDCGACTVVVGELTGDSVRYRAINSCIVFLATLDGKQLLTVEDLRCTDGSLHAVQQAMVETHGSQCGFCTPGFVMSLWALSANNGEATRSVIEEALAGNLCRCTGYDSIIEAATTVLARPRTEETHNPQAVHSALTDLTKDGPLEIDVDGRRFLAPRDLKELHGFQELYPNAVLVAGATDVGLWVTKQHHVLETVIYLGNIAELRVIESSNDALTIGACVPLTDAVPELVVHFPQLGPFFQRFASTQIRNSGTLGGNIANASPIGDSMPPLLVLNATLTVRRGSVTRDIPLDEFFLDYQKTALGEKEIIETIKVPIRRDVRLGVYKISKRKEQDISTVCGAFGVVVEGDEIVKARVAFGGMSATPARAPKCELALLGQPWTMDTVRKAADALEQDFTPISDMRGSAEYRRLVARNLVEKFYREINGQSVDVFAQVGSSDD